jgi:cytochrome b subunit of formate dehydrogenase
MAKKKRRITEEPEEEYEFSPTEFNEREFILKEIYSTKVFAVAMVLALIVGVVTGILIKNYPMVSGDWNLMSVIATLISFAVMFMIKKIAAILGLHPELMDIKSMAGNYIIYLAMALAICIITMQF